MEIRHRQRHEVAEESSAELDIDTVGGVCE